MTRRLSRLYRGSESSIRFNLLMEGVGLRSEPMRAALEDYLVKGIDKEAAAALNGVRLPYFGIVTGKQIGRAHV